MQKVFTYCGFNKAEMVQLARNAVDMCWASDDEKVAIYRELDNIPVI
jgi:adenosine deaminase